MAYTIMQFIELPLFTKYLDKYLTSNEYTGLLEFLMVHPQFGDLIPRGGGIRKIRWQAKGKGKRGGVRIIYFYSMKKNKIILMLIYSKNEMSNISAETLKRLRKRLEK